MFLCLDLQDEEEYVDEHQPFPSLSQVWPFYLFITLTSGFIICFIYIIHITLTSLFSFDIMFQIFQAVPDHVGFNIELKWISQFKVCVASSWFDLGVSGEKNTLIVSVSPNRMVPGMRNSPPTSTWISSWTSSSHVCCRTLAIGE